MGPRRLVLACLEASRVESLDRKLVAARAKRQSAGPPRGVGHRGRDAQSRERLHVAVIGEVALRVWTAVVARAPPAREGGQGDRLARREAPEHAQVRETVVVAVAVGVVAEGARVGRARRVDRAPARGKGRGDRPFDGGEARREARLRGAAGARVDEEAGLRGGAREDLHDAADRIRPVQAGERPLHDLDPLDERERDVFDGGGAHRGRTHAQAVHQHQGVAGIGAAQEEARGLACSPGAAELDEGAALEDLGERDGPGTVDVLAGDHLDVAQGIGGALGAADGGNDDGVEGLEGEGGCWGGRELLGGGAQCHGGSQAGQRRGFPGGLSFVVRASQRPRRLLGCIPPFGAFAVGPVSGLARLDHRLPGARRPQWLGGGPHWLTVAGAAPASHRLPGHPIAAAMIGRGASKGQALHSKSLSK